MKGKWFFNFIFILGFLWIVNGIPVHAQKTPKILSLLYSNSIYGQIDPCPT
jgi:hypothetical protein